MFEFLPFLKMLVIISPRYLNFRTFFKLTFLIDIKDGLEAISSVVLKAIVSVLSVDITNPNLAKVSS